MKIIPTALPGVQIIEPDVYADERGFFTETWHAERYAQHGLTEQFVQDNLSCSHRHVLRGLHFQHPGGQGKLVYVLQGEVLDVAVDIRHGSPCFGQWVSVLLSAENRRQLYIPEGFAHGFCVTSEQALFAYKCTRHYNSQTERSLLWNDPSLGISWPVSSPLVSDKDAQAIPLSGYALEELPQYKV